MSISSDIAESAVRGPGLDMAAGLRRTARNASTIGKIESHHIGASRSLPFSMIQANDETGFLRKIEFILAERAAIPTNPLARKLYDQEVRKFKRWAKENLQGDAKKAFDRDIKENVRHVHARYGDVVERAARSVSRKKRADQQKIEACYNELVSHLNQLIGTPAAESLSPLASEAFQKIMATTPHLRESLHEMMEYVVNNRTGIVRDAEKLRGYLEQLNTATPGSVLANSLPRKIANAGGLRSKIKGFLGEAYMVNWGHWLREVDFLLENARRIAKYELPDGFEAIRVQGGLRINGKEAWDDAILLVNMKTDPMQVILYAAAQTKVEKSLSALKQLIRDRTREAGNQTTNTDVRILIDGKPQKFTLGKLPDGIETQRFVYFANGATVAKSHIKRLREHGIKTQVTEMDISFNSIHDLSLEIMFAVEDMVKKGLI